MATTWQGQIGSREGLWMKGVALRCCLTSIGIRTSARTRHGACVCVAALRVAHLSCLAAMQERECPDRAPRARARSGEMHQLNRSSAKHQRGERAATHVVT